MLHLSHHTTADRHRATEPVDYHHARVIALASVRTEGVPALTRLLLHSRRASPEATLKMGPLLRALPGIGPIGSRQLLHLAHIRDSDRLGDLTPDQRGELAFFMAHIPRPLGSGEPRPLGSGELSTPDQPEWRPLEWCSRILE